MNLRMATFQDRSDPAILAYTRLEAISIGPWGGKTRCKACKRACKRMGEWVMRWEMATLDRVDRNDRRGVAR